MLDIFGDSRVFFFSFGLPGSGLGRWEEAEPLLDAAEQALGGQLGGSRLGEALGEARFYLALLEAAAATEACLPALDARLIEASTQYFAVVALIAKTRLYLSCWRMPPRTRPACPALTRA